MLAGAYRFVFTLPSSAEKSHSESALRTKSLIEVNDERKSLGCSPFFKGGIQLASCLRQKLHYLRKTFLTAVSDNMRPALSKTFQDFGFFFDVNQTVTIAINP